MNRFSLVWIEDCFVHESVVDEMDCRRRFPDIREGSRSEGRADGWLYGVGEVQRFMMRSISSE